MFGKRLAALAATTLAAMLVAATPAQAVIWWEDPPACKEGQWHHVKSDTGAGTVGWYSKVGEHTETRIYGGGREVRYIWDFMVEAPMAGGPMIGMVPVGRAKKHCGTDFFPTYA